MVCEANHWWRQEEAKPSLGGKYAEKKTDHCRHSAWHTSEDRGRLPWAPRALVPKYNILVQHLERREGSRGENMAVKLIYLPKVKFIALADTLV